MSAPQDTNTSRGYRLEVTQSDAELNNDLGWSIANQFHRRHTTGSDQNWQTHPHSALRFAVYADANAAKGVSDAHGMEPLAFGPCLIRSNMGIQPTRTPDPGLLSRHQIGHAVEHYDRRCSAKMSYSRLRPTLRQSVTAKPPPAKLIQSAAAFFNRDSSTAAKPGFSRILTASAKNGSRKGSQEMTTKNGAMAAPMSYRPALASGSFLQYASSLNSDLNAKGSAKDGGPIHSVAETIEPSIMLAYDILSNKTICLIELSVIFAYDELLKKTICLEV